MGTVKIGRKALYKRVWSEAMTKLAKEYGLSDRGLAKLCQRNGIPRPPCGYWARKAVGQKVRNAPLPRPDDDREIEIRAHEPRGPAIQGPGMPEETLPPIAVPDDLRHPHPLVRWTRVRFDGGDKDAFGRFKPAWGCLDINVTKASLYRALRIMNAILAECERRGWSVSVPEGTDGGTTVTIDGAQVSICLEELTQPREFTEKEKILAAQKWKKASVRRMARVANGKLALWLYVKLASGRGGWRDSKQARLEKLLPSFMAGLAEAGVIQKRRDEARAAAEAEQCRIQEERERVAEDARLEQERVDKLVSKALAWHSRRFLSLYLDDVEARCPTVPTTDAKSTAQESEFRQWLAWAREQATRLDPLDPCKYFEQRPYWVISRDDPHAFWAGWWQGKRHG